MGWLKALAMMSAAIASGISFYACAQDYPARTIRIIVPFAPQTNPETKKRVLDLGAELAIESPQAFADVISRGYASIGKLIRTAGIRIDADY